MAWVEKTYAWVVPTSLGIIALKTHGMQNHARVKEGVALLLDRQLPDGGWNYGDTFTFGTQLLSFPDTTGFALEALSGLCDRSRVGKYPLPATCCRKYTGTAIVVMGTHRPGSLVVKTRSLSTVAGPECCPAG